MRPGQGRWKERRGAVSEAVKKLNPGAMMVMMIAYEGGNARQWGEAGG